MVCVVATNCLNLLKACLSYGYLILPYYRDSKTDYRLILLTFLICGILTLVDYKHLDAKDQNKMACNKLWIMVRKQNCVFFRIFSSFSYFCTHRGALTLHGIFKPLLNLTYPKICMKRYYGNTIKPATSLSTYDP